MKNKQKLVCASLFLAGLVTGAQQGAFAQDYRSEFERFKKERQQSFDDYYARVNAEFSAYLKEAWREFNLLPAEPLDPGPKPVVAPVAPPAPKLDDPTIDLPEVTVPDDARPNLGAIPIPHVEPIPVRPKEPQIPRFDLNYYGIPAKIAKAQGNLSMSGVSEDAISKAWDQCADGRFAQTLADLKLYKEQYQLPDWAFYELSQRCAQEYTSQKDEAVLVHFFLLSQSGYSARLMRCKDHLYLLMSSDNRLVNRGRFSLDGKSFYIMDPTFQSKGASCYICNFQFPQEKHLDLFITHPPKFPSASNETVRTIQSKRYPAVTMKMTVNPGLKAFYENYPKSNDFNVYSSVRFSEPNITLMKECLQPLLKGKSQREAANILINLVQTGFDYKTDQDQFGYERPLFAEELFFYPYSDCEDRSVLYALLVRELMGLDVVLVRYPGHMATAVCFTEKVEGTTLQYKGKTYTISDPTYIGADVGMNMPDMVKVEEVLPSLFLSSNR